MINEGPQPVPKTYTCTGCKHLNTEYWLNPYDGDEGVRARCLKENRYIATYWYDYHLTPAWCPYFNK